MTLLLALGCPHYETVDEACRDEVPGAASVDDAAAVESFQRFDCYRNLAGLTRASFDDRVQEATVAHAAYLGTTAESGTPDEDAAYDWWSEDPAQSGFTGESVWERLEATGYPIAAGTLSPGETVYLHKDLGAEGVDACFGDPGFREFVLQPAWMDGGWSEGSLADDTPFAYGTVVVPWVSSEGAARPIVFPVDGQQDVPTRGQICSLWDPWWGRTIGFPVTLTFAWGNGDETYANADFVETPVLEGPDGPVDVEVRGLGVSTWHTLGVLPLDPLAADTDYAFNTRVRFGSWEQDVNVAFRTEAE